MRRIFFLLLWALQLSICPASAHTTNNSGIKEKLKALATAKIKSECASCKVTVECKWMALIVKRSSPAAITGLFFDDPGLPAGYVTAKVAFNNTNPTLKSQVQLYVGIQKKVPLAATTIKGGAIVSGSDIVWKWKDISHLSRLPVGSADMFNGKTTARMIRKGHVFYTSDLVGAGSVHPGDQVSMQYDETGVQIAIKCIAREAKATGQKIRLYSKETGQRYLAKIISKNKIVWVKTL